MTTIAAVNDLSLIPPHIILHVGQSNTPEARLYVFWKENETIVVEAPPCNAFGALRSVNGHPELMESLHEIYGTAEKEYIFFLEIIQQHMVSLIPKFGRGKTNQWLRFRPKRAHGNKRGSRDGVASPRYEFVDGTQSFGMECERWAPLVDEGDVNITMWIDAAQRRGTWRGQEVEIWIGWNHRWAQLLGKETQGHAAVRGLDVSFSVLAHITRCGKIIGLMTEYTSRGRMVEYRDRRAVYEAVMRLQLRGLLHRGLDASTISILDDGEDTAKVRFLNLSSITTYPPHERSTILRQDAQSAHWQRLTEIFDDLQTAGFNYFSGLAQLKQSVKAIPLLPSPEKPLLFRLAMQIQLPSFLRGCNPSIRSNNHNKRKYHRFPRPPVDDNSPDVYPTAVIANAPVSLVGRSRRPSSTPPNTPQRRQFSSHYHPYRHHTTKIGDDPDDDEEDKGAESDDSERTLEGDPDSEEPKVFFTDRSTLSPSPTDHPPHMVSNDALCTIGLSNGGRNNSHMLWGLNGVILPTRHSHPVPGRRLITL